MWPLVMAAMRRNAPFITLPFAAIVGLYQLELMIFFSLNFITITVLLLQDLLVINWKDTYQTNTHRTTVSFHFLNAHES